MVGILDIGSRKRNIGVLRHLYSFVLEGAVDSMSHDEIMHHRPLAPREASWQILARADAFIALSMNEESRINVQGKIDDPKDSIVVDKDAIDVLACCDGIEARQEAAKGMLRCNASRAYKLAYACHRWVGSEPRG